LEEIRAVVAVFKKEKENIYKAEQKPGENEGYVWFFWNHCSEPADFVNTRGIIPGCKILRIKDNQCFMADCRSGWLVPRLYNHLYTDQEPGLIFYSEQNKRCNLFVHLIIISIRWYN
jgi:hypothetical protein